MKHKKIMHVVAFAVLALCGVILFFKGGELMTETKGTGDIISLPAAKLDGTISVEKALATRRSIRSYQDEPITLEQLSQLLWAAQGITSPEGLRASPSAGALYPMELYVVVDRVTALEVGVYKYDYNAHSLIHIKAGDQRQALSRASLGQGSVGAGAVDIVITGIYERTASKYEKRAERYVMMEAGHIAQNIYLQCIPLGLATVVVGAFDDKSVQSVVGAQADEEPLYIMPVGKI